MASTALKKITTRAKAIRRIHPGVSWKSAIKKAGAEYRSGSIGKTRKKIKKHYKSVTRKKAPKRHHRIGSSDQVTRSKTHTDYNRNKVNISVGHVNTHMKEAKKALQHLIGIEESKRFVAKGARAKNKIRKKLNELKQKFRRVAC